MPPLGSRALTRTLALLHAAAALVFLLLLPAPAFGDEEMYLRLAESLAEGRFTWWTDLDAYVPDTLRTPGYPLFLLLAGLGDPRRVWLVRIVQTACIGLAVLLAGRTAASLASRAGRRPRAAANLTWLLLLPNVQFLYYAQVVAPEAILVLLLVAGVWLWETRRDRWGRWPLGLALGGLLGVATGVRPVVLLLPPALLAWAALRRIRGGPRRDLAVAAIAVATFALTLVPFTVWNGTTHGRWSPLPVEGSVTHMYLGFWQFRLPGRSSPHPWPITYMGHEWIAEDNPAAVDRYAAEWNAFWTDLDRASEAALTPDERCAMAEMRTATDRFPVWPAEVQAMRNATVAAALRADVRAAPLEWAATRAWTGWRLWIPNLDPGELARATTLGGRARVLYPFVVLGLTFGLLGTLVLIRAVRSGARLTRVAAVPVAVVAYAWAVHLPMPIQARYTVPVGMVAILLIAVGLLADATGDPGTSVPEAGLEPARD